MHVVLLGRPWSTTTATGCERIDLLALAVELVTIGLGADRKRVNAKRVNALTIRPSPVEVDGPVCVNMFYARLDPRT